MSKTVEIIETFNKTDFRKKMIPLEVTAGWPNIRYAGKTLCITVPYYRYSMGADNKINLFPIYCSVTVPVKSPERVIDFTIYPYQNDWSDIDYSKPCGTFKHEAVEKLTKSEYENLRGELYDCYDEIITAAEESRAPQGMKRMSELMSLLIEPELFEQYNRINNVFYSKFYRQ